jgi:hypothetical protein
MCSSKGTRHSITLADQLPRFVLGQSMRHRPPAIGTQTSFFSGVPFAQ